MKHSGVVVDVALGLDSVPARIAEALLSAGRHEIALAYAARKHTLKHRYPATSLAQAVVRGKAAP